MSKENEKGLDDLFKKKLEDPVDQISYRDADWSTLETMLNKHKKKRGIIYLLPVLSGVAALLLLFLGWWAFRTKDVRPGAPVKPLAVVSHPRVNTGTNGGTARLPTYHNPNSTPLPAGYTQGLTPSKNSRASRSLLTKSAGGARRTTGSAQMGGRDTIVGRANETLMAYSTSGGFEQQFITAQPVKQVNLLNSSFVATAAVVNKKNQVRPIQSRAFRPQFALTVLAAPDINGVGSFQQSKVGTNLGMQFSASVSKKLTITTGALYSVKPYSMAFENYHTPYQFPVNPSNVTADCRMLDIPLNLGYQLYNKQQNKISIGTGLSSYIMLHESYKFNYGNSYYNPYISSPANYTVPNSGKYFFGVLNLNATYQRQLSPKVAFTVQPYLKLPLTNIGYSQVRLQTTGVALGLSWNLSSTSNP